MSFPRYPKYKPSGVEWLGEVPEHWDVKRLRRLVGLNPSKSETASMPTDSLVSFLPMEAIGENGSIDLERQRVLSEVASGYSYFRDGDVVIAKITPCFENGKGALVRSLTNSCGFGTTELIVMRPNPASMEPEFLHRLVTSDSFRKLGEASMYGAGGQKRVPDDFVREFPAPLPPTPEQRAIAAFLDRETAKIDALIAEQEKLIELLAEKRQAVISHAVTKGLNPAAPMKPSGIECLGDVPAHWAVGPLKRFVTSLDGMRVPLSAEERGSRQGEFPYYGASGIIDHIDEFIFEEDLVLVSEDGANLLNRTTPIAFPARGRYWVNNHAHILRPEDPHIVFWSERIDSIDLSPVITGSAQPKLTADELMRLPVAVPPTTAERGSIERFVLAAADACETLSASARSVVDLLRERRSALISAAVTGQIDVRNATPEHAA